MWNLAEGPTTCSLSLEMLSSSEKQKHHDSWAKISSFYCNNKTECIDFKIRWEHRMNTAIKRGLKVMAFYKICVINFKLICWIMEKVKTRGEKQNLMWILRGLLLIPQASWHTFSRAHIVSCMICKLKHFLLSDRVRMEVWYDIKNYLNHMFHSGCN